MRGKSAMAKQLALLLVLSFDVLASTALSSTEEAALMSLCPNFKKRNHYGYWVPLWNCTTAALACDQQNGFGSSIASVEDFVEPFLSSTFLPLSKIDF